MFLSAFTASLLPAVSRRTRHGFRPQSHYLECLCDHRSRPDDVLSPIVTPGFTVTLAPEAIHYCHCNRLPVLDPHCVSASVGCPGVYLNAMRLSLSVPNRNQHTSNNVSPKFSKPYNRCMNSVVHIDGLLHVNLLMFSK